MMAITPEALLVWFVWGFFMGLGWTIAAWLITRLLLSRF
jgi:hypothetical protein